MTDIVNILRQRHRNVTGGNPLIEPIKGPTIFSEAADEIVRLRAERDEARRMYCYAIPENCDEHEARKIAWERGWDCFPQEDGK